MYSSKHRKTFFLKDLTLLCYFDGAATNTMLSFQGTFSTLGLKGTYCKTCSTCKTYEYAKTACNGTHDVTCAGALNGGKAGITHVSVLSNSYFSIWFISSRTCNGQNFIPPATFWYNVK